ncbi:MAG: PKD domain-containing protein [Candidatus Hydrogenedentes bacterium]|nr:PKD domain-containing protein [Candidatus Hydrogenedentota bacterium]
MKNLRVRVVLIGSLLALGWVAPEAAGLTAVIEVGEDPFYTTNKATKFGGTELTNSFAPLPVFFEGWKSSPREEIVDYTWDFGDGSPVFEHGFNGVHVYETPGTYTCTLTVKDAANNTHSTTKTVTVQPRTGPTYYVDSQVGNDIYYDGTAQSGAPFDDIVMNTSVDASSFTTGYRLQKFTVTDENAAVVGGMRDTNFLDKAIDQNVYQLNPDGTLAKDAAGKLIAVGKIQQTLTVYDVNGANLSDQPKVITGLTMVDPVNTATVLLSNVTFTGENPLALPSTITNSVIINSKVIGSTIINCRIENSTVVDSKLVCVNNISTARTSKDVYGGFNTKPGPWKTATMAFEGIEQSRYLPGSQILFKRGQIFAMEGGEVQPRSAGVSKYGYLFGAYGDGPKPIIQHTGTSTAVWLLQQVNGMAHVGFSDLECRMTSVDGVKAGEFYKGTQETTNILFLRMDFKNISRAVTIARNESGPADADNHSGVFIVNCTTQNDIANYQPGAASDTHVFAAATRYVLLNNNFDLSGNHIAYLEFLNKVLIVGNTFSRPAFGRTAMRIAGRGGSTLNFTNPTNNVYVADNQYIGWVDPLNESSTSSPHHGGGTRYNYELVYLAPNETDNQAMTDVVFERNTLQDAETLMLIGSYENLTVRNNTFTTADSYIGAPRVLIGAPFDRRPVKNVKIVDNNIVSNEGRSGKAGLFTIERYGGPAYPGRAIHEEVVIQNNTVSFQNGEARLIAYVKDKDPDVTDAAQVAQVTSNNNKIYSTSDTGLFQIGGTATVAGTVLSLAQWRTLTSNDLASIVLPPGSQAPFPGLAQSPASVMGEPTISVDYSGAQEVSGSGLKFVHLWARKGSGAWQDTTLTKTASGDTFTFTPSGDDTYYFATQAEDNAGNFSPEPTGDGHTQTVFAAGAPPPADTTPPSPGLAIAPANASASPINVTYSGAADETNGSGLKEVHLYFKKGAGGTWQDSNLPVQTAASGGFNFSGVSGDDTYFFATRAADNAGNLSPEPSGSGQANTIFAAPPSDTTAPIPGTLTVQQFAKSSPILVSYSGASDAASGLSEVRLWYRFGVAGNWLETGLASPLAGDTFSFVPSQGDGTYFYHLIAEDNAGNFSAGPTANGMGSVAYDTIAPTPASVAVDDFSGASPIATTYSGASDNGSGIKTVRLWYRKGTGGWVASAASSSAASGPFSFAETTGDATYFFATQVEDQAGNLSPEPSGSGSDSTILDTVPPTTGTVTSPQYRNTGSITVTYSGVSDAGSGLQQVKLWFKKDTGAWTETALGDTLSSSSFSFTPQSGNGTYFFAIKTLDNAGKSSPDPTGSGQANTKFDAAAPSGGAITAPASDDGAPISLTYSGVTDSGGSGLKTVYLWAKKGTGGTWANTNQTATGGSGSFGYSGVTGNDTYFFALQSEDNAGNFSSEPSGSGLASTVFSTIFTAGVASSPQSTKSGPITVSFSGANESGGSGIKQVHLWSKKGTGGTWANTGSAFVNSGGALPLSGTISFNGFSVDATYYFAVQAETNAGALTAEPFGNGDTNTVFDTTRPTPGTWSAPAFEKKNTISIAYSGAGDTGSGLNEVRLWYKKGTGGSWTATDQFSATPEGTLKFSGMSGNATYFFYLVAKDNVGNTSAAAGTEVLVSTVYDNAPPTAAKVTAPSFSSSSSISLDYAGGADNGDSGLKAIHLWARKDNGGWADTGLVQTTTPGKFTYPVTAGDGTYNFATVSEDNAGNTSSDPSGNGDGSTLVDRAGPNAGTVTAPPYRKASPIQVDYSGVTDAGSGLSTVTLWVRKDNNPWAATTSSLTTEVGSFSYTQMSGSGTYFFALQAVDKGGAKSPTPTDNGQASTVFDTLAPTTGTLVAPPNDDSSPITISYSGAGDSGGSGLKAVYLWARKGAGGAWGKTTLSDTAPSGTFAYTGMSGNDTYFFALQTEDNAGNLSADPFSNGMGSTVYNVQFSPGTAVAPAFAKSGPITITFSGAVDLAGGGIKQVQLWFRKGQGGSWGPTGTPVQSTSGSFSFNDFTGNDNYYFATRAESVNGAFTSAPFGNGDTGTVFDNVAPSAGSLSSPTYAKQSPIVIQYSGASDGGSGLKEVRLWTKKGLGGAWQNTGEVRDTATGQFQFTPSTTGDDVYHFYVQAVDKAGNTTPDPTDSLVFGGSP